MRQQQHHIHSICLRIRCCRRRCCYSSFFSLYNIENLCKLYSISVRERILFFNGSFILFHPLFFRRVFLFLLFDDQRNESARVAFKMIFELLTWIANFRFNHKFMDTLLLCPCGQFGYRALHSIHSCSPWNSDLSVY